MNVLIVNRYMGLYGGAETVVTELSRHLHESHIGSRIVTLNISDEVRSHCKGLDIVTPREAFPYQFRSARVVSSVGISREIAALRRLVKDNVRDFDIINAHNFPAHWVTGGSGKKTVWMCNEIPDFYNNPCPSPAVRLLRAAGIQCDRFLVNRNIDAICVSDEYNARMVRLRYNRDARIIPYGIEYDFFAAAVRAGETAGPYRAENPFIVLQPGMHSPQKDQMASVEAVAEVKKSIPRVKLILAGRFQEPYTSMVKAAAEAHGVAQDVVLTGHVSKEQLRDLYRGCHVAVFPVKAQGGWLAPFEAVCAGKPVIVSSTMGASSVIKREHLGMVSGNLAEAIREVYHNYPEYLLQARNAKEWVRNNLTWRKFSLGMIQLFEDTLTQRSRQ